MQMKLGDFSKEAAFAWKTLDQDKKNQYKAKAKEQNDKVPIQTTLKETLISIKNQFAESMKNEPQRALLKDNESQDIIPT